MPIADIFLKMAEQQVLTPSEKIELQQFVDMTYKAEGAVNSWISSPNSPESPYIRSLKGLEAFFEFIPTEALFAVKSDDVSIPDDTETTINFSSGTTSTYFNRINGTIYIPHSSNLIAVVGKAQFEDNSTGRRAVHVNRYTEAGAFQVGDTLISLSASNTDPTTVSWAAVLYLPENSATHSLQFTVVQTSGGNLLMQYMSIGVFVVR